ncbi:MULTISPECIES: methylated-DNA--[protein]-cysteine S-methyltransferase [unclassified Campylobacter]|uniref:methylated-DNA--[protein]-cysteine S-methyltransferase n=1 Tax=unclassified Campylobacter TaxID=2593542 RepID=UPI001237C867|nr:MULTISPECIES: methylated-DNA--[protein]-cysteine S-methyltransferase [unclassified Campylobacter]KAA6224892.1 methylated-DNA--[protein]-cysteine S-methyltransferase [Campylobacter sp. LR185c]KAA6226323.1 methylated-DNA--[protein]-cysteine S-methyltransferase [Campylobacter sp. LR286c]KAA6226815.1 methylated-DNA--[protein]-cysteine S-methyltransferase [Campylobacter sp. LR196d]KAA6230252.1 methylated-DNA--[protein]-cysteine S-methyltransferase [Campylobacter sp. LR291e]KAA6233773.1 methylate
MFKLYYKSPFCYLLLQSNENKLISIEKCEKMLSDSSCDLLNFAKNELDLYFKGKLKEFKTTLFLNATNFQTKVYKQLLKIPYGHTATYKDIAIKIQNPKAFRAVGNANKNNPLPLFIPCHRVLASNGLGGYNLGIEFKKFLLELERKNI